MFIPSILKMFCVFVFLHHHIGKSCPTTFCIGKSTPSSHHILAPGLEDTWAFAHGGLAGTKTDVVLKLLCLTSTISSSFKWLLACHSPFYMVGHHYYFPLASHTSTNSTRLFVHFVNNSASILWSLNPLASDIFLCPTILMGPYT